MNPDSFKEFENIKNQMRSCPVGEVGARLEELDARFVSVLDDWRLLPTEEQAVHRGNFLQVRYMYHDIGMIAIDRMMEASYLSEQNQEQADELVASSSMNVPSLITETIDEQADGGDASAEQNVAGGENSEAMEQGELNSSHSTNTRQENCLSADNAIFCSTCAEASAATAHETIKPPYPDFCKIIEPIFQIERIEQPDERAFNLILVAITDTINNARIQGYTIAECTTMIIAFLHRQLDITSQSLWSWEAERSAPANPTIDLFIDFLTRRAKRISPLELSAGIRAAQAQIVNAGASTSCGSSCTGAIPKVKPASRKDSAIFGLRKSSAAGAISKKAKAQCAHCGYTDHLLHRCQYFLSMDRKGRIGVLNSKKLCFNCFSPMHTTKDCHDGPCKRCNKKHNSLICPKAEPKDGESGS